MRFIIAVVKCLQYIDLIADLRLRLWQHIHSSCVQSAAHHRLGSSTVQLAFAAHIEWF